MNKLLIFVLLTLSWATSASTVIVTKSMKVLPNEHVAIELERLKSLAIKEVLTDSKAQLRLTHRSLNNEMLSESVDVLLPAFVDAKVLEHKLTPCQPYDCLAAKVAVELKESNLRIMERYLISLNALDTQLKYVGQMARHPVEQNLFILKQAYQQGIRTYSDTKHPNWLKQLGARIEQEKEQLANFHWLRVVSSIAKHYNEFHYISNVLSVERSSANTVRFKMRLTGFANQVPQEWTLTLTKQLSKANGTEFVTKNKYTQHYEIKTLNGSHYAAEHSPTKLIVGEVCFSAPQYQSAPVIVNAIGRQLFVNKSELTVPTPVNSRQLRVEDLYSQKPADVLSKKELCVWQTFSYDYEVEVSDRDMLAYFQGSQALPMPVLTLPIDLDTKKLAEPSTLKLLQYSDEQRNITMPIDDLEGYEASENVVVYCDATHLTCEIQARQRF